eukprot:c28876_g1_i1 orf=285-3560(-)
MLIRIALAITCSIVAFAYAQLRNNQSAKGKVPKDGYEKHIRGKDIHSHETSSARKEEEEEEVKRVSTFSPASSCRSFQESDQLLLPEFDDLFSGGLDLPSDSSTDDTKVRKNEKASSLAKYNDNLKVQDGEFVKVLNADDNLDSRKYDSTSEDDEALEIFEALASFNKQAIQIDSKSFKGDGHCALSMSQHPVNRFNNSLANDTSELVQLRTLVTELQEKEIKLEAELLEYYGLKEQEDNYKELERQLRKKNSEIEKLNVKINSLEAQKKELTEELAAKEDLKKELEEARAKIRELQRQIQNGTAQTKVQLLVLKRQVATLQEKEQEASKKDFELEQKLQTLKELEIEVVELRRTNKELQHQKRELTVKLTAAETNITELSNITESDLVARAEAEAAALKHTNEDLSKQVEGLQMNRFSEVEELVYLRWVNACLRYELRNFKAPPGKATALDLNKSLSPKSQERAKQLMLEYAGPDLLALQAREHGDNDFETMSSQSSTPSELGDCDDSSLENVSGRHFGSKKSGLIRKLRKWGRSKDDSQVTPSSSTPDSRNSPGRMSLGNMHSGSKGPLESLILRNSSDVVAITTYGSNTVDTAGKLSPSCRSLSDCSVSDSNVTGHDSPGNLPSIRTKSLADDAEITSSVATSFQLMSKSVVSVLDDKYPAFKDRHKLALEREKAIKEKADQARVEKLAERFKVDTPGQRTKVVKLLEKARVEKLTEVDAKVAVSEQNSERLEVSRLKLSEIEKRAPRVASAPPKASASGPPAVNILSKVLGALPVPPAPLLQSPGAPGVPLPPPLPPRGGNLAKAHDSKVQRAPEVIEFYQSLMKRETRKDTMAMGSADVNVADVRNHMIGEIENRSAFLLAVKADVETQGEFVASLAMEVRAAAYTDIDDVVAFVNWLDEELSFLVDERAVLKHFDWPEGKADVLREAAFEYQDLKKLESEIGSYEDDPCLPCDIALKKMLSLLEKVEQSVYALLRTRDMAISRYKEFNIPTYWLLDSGLIGKIKVASVQLARQYMSRVASELDGFGAASGEPLQEFLLLQGVRFAFRVHQFAGGFDADSMRAFEDLRGRVHMHTKGQSEGKNELR